MLTQPIALVPTGFGVNCEVETSHALKLAGFLPVQKHLNDVLTDRRSLKDVKLLVLCGGFSFGDHLGSGRVQANRWRSHLSDELNQFVQNGGMVLGICNGFQTLVHLGLLPTGHVDAPSVALVANMIDGTEIGFYDGWVKLSVDQQSPCVFTKGIDTLEFPIRHGEGRLVASQEMLQHIETHHLSPLKYIGPNPNGSAFAIAGLCDPTGRVFGLMPHPEAFLYRENHPQWRLRAIEPQGGQIFKNAATCF